MRVHVGTSGWNYEAWRGSFYPEDLPASKMLAFYAERFSTVEVNYTYYRMPTDKALQGWSDQTPTGFRFAVKASQRITHHARLKADKAADTTAFFCEKARLLGDKLAPILFQLPPNLKKDTPRLTAFLALLPKDLRTAFELRHASWFEDDVYDALRAAGAALCVAEGDELATPMVRTAPYGYLRLRREDYDDAMLDTWAERVRGAGFEEDVFVYFKHEDEARGTVYADGFARRLSG